MGPGSAFSDDISKWQRKLQTVEQALKTWVSVQTKWLEMEEMFSMINVILSLNTHARVYAHVDLEFTHMMKSVGENPNIVQQCCKPGRSNFCYGVIGPDLFVRCLDCRQIFSSINDSGIALP